MPAKAKDLAARRSAAHAMRLKGETREAIAAALGYRSARVLEADLAAALGADDRTTGGVLALELARLDAMQSALWTKVLDGDVRAVEQAQRLTEQRLRLAHVGDAPPIMLQAFDRTIQKIEHDDRNAAAIAAGRRIAERIDAARMATDPQAETKAMYLVPHLFTVLRELGATPKARGELLRMIEPTGSASPKGEEPVDAEVVEDEAPEVPSLEAWKREKRGQG